MTPDQIDHNLSEMQTRLERLRALYEQYFMGIERLEPHIPRKDVERRIQELRKVRFQNTAKRFKFQTVVQRYNTLQQYWNRTCRDIENGTYRKHLQKAARKAAQEEMLAAPEPSKEDVQQRAQAAQSAKTAAVDDLAALMDGDVDLDAALGDALREVEKPQDTKTSGLLKLGKRDTKTSGTSRTSPALSLGKAPSRQSKAPAPLGKSSGTSPRGATSPKPAGLGALPPLKRAGTAPARPTGGEKTGGPPPAPSRRPKPPGTPAAGNPLANLTPKKPVPTKPQQRAAAKPSGANGLSDARIKAIHQSYSDARRKTNSTEVSYEKLAKSIRETEKKLRAKNQGRNVEFDVSIKAGKAILKPKLK